MTDEPHPLVKKLIALTDETLKETPEQRALNDLRYQIKGMIGGFEQLDMKEPEPPEEEPKRQACILLKNWEDLYNVLSNLTRQYSPEYVFIGTPEEYPCLLFVLSADGEDTAAVQGLFIYKSHMGLLENA